MQHRYKIFEVRASVHGNLAGTARILYEPCSIGELLGNEIRNLGGASDFGVESPTFAWLINARSHHLIFQEGDSDFNIDLAISQITNITGRPSVDWFNGLQGRMTLQRGSMFATLAKRGLCLAEDVNTLPYDGMGGILLTNPNAVGRTVFAAPPPPCRTGVQSPQTAQDLLDIWFRQLTDILTSLKTRLGTVEIAIEVGGTIPIPEWFREWCSGNDIPIVEIEAQQNFQANAASGRGLGNKTQNTTIA